MNSRTAGGAGRARQHALVLEEPARAVEAIPVEEGVERVEEGRGRDHLLRLPGQVTPVDADVGDARGERVERPVGELHGDGDRATGGRRGRPPRGLHLVGGGPAAGHQRAAAQGAPAHQAIDPSHGHREARRAARQRLHVVVDVADPLALLPHPRRGDALQLELHLEDVTEQPHPAHRGPEQIRLHRRRTVDHGVIREAHAQRSHVGTEAAGAVVILAVYVAGHHAAQGDELRARGHRREEAAGYQYRVQLIEAEAGLGAHDAAGGIEGQDAIGQPGIDHPVLGLRRQRRVTIGATEPAREHGAARGRLQVLGDELAPRQRRAAPAAQRRGGFPRGRGRGRRGRGIGDHACAGARHLTRRVGRSPASPRPRWTRR